MSEADAPLKEGVHAAYQSALGSFSMFDKHSGQVANAPRCAFTANSACARHDGGVLQLSWGLRHDTGPEPALPVVPASSGVDIGRILCPTFKPAGALNAKSRAPEQGPARLCHLKARHIQPVVQAGCDVAHSQGLYIQ